MSATFAVFDPTTFPTARSPRSALEASTLTSSSGIEVPKATTVRPTTIALTPSSRASREAPRTRPSAPPYSSSRPNPNRSARVSTSERSWPVVAEPDDPLAGEIHPAELPQGATLDLADQLFKPRHGGLQLEEGSSHSGRRGAGEPS